MDPLAFQGGDGKGFQTHILSYLRNGGPLEVNVLSPLQGAFAPQLPLNTWLNPGYAVFRLFDWNDAMLYSMLASFLVLAGSTLILARILGLGWLTATIAAQATVITMPPFLLHFGLNTQYMLVPPTTTTVAMMTLALAVFVKLTPRSSVKAATTAVFLATLIFLALLVDPLFFMATALAMVPVFAVFAVADGITRLTAMRIFALVLTISILFILGAFDYLTTLVMSSVRNYFKLEVGRPQNPAEATMLLAHPYLFGRVAIFLVAGWILGMLFTNGRRKTFAAACLLHWVFVLAQAAVYIFSDLDWLSVAPMYLEQAAYHIYILGAMSGWAGGLGRLSRAIADWRSRPFVPSQYSWAAAAIPIALLVYLIEIVPTQRSAYYEPWPAEQALVDTLRGSLSREKPDSALSGSVVLLDTRNHYDNILTIVQLWRNDISTLNEYGQMITPAMHYFGTRVLHNADKSRMMNTVQFQETNTKIYSALGVRYMLTDKPLSVAGTIDRGVLEGFNYSGKLRRWYLYEIPGYNSGNYSPVAYEYANNAADATKTLSAAGFNYKHTVVVNSSERLPTLVPATRSKLYYSKGRLRVLAQSTAESLVILPVQFSHCLKIKTVLPNARLLRTDLLLTGLLFSGEVDLEIYYNFSFFNSTCRNKDILELHQLNFLPDTARMPDGKFRHPYAVGHQTLSTSLGKLRQQLDQASEYDKNTVPHFSGQTFRRINKLLGLNR